MFSRNWIRPSLPLALIALLASASIQAVQPDKKNLPIGPTPQEKIILKSGFLRNSVSRSNAPVGPVRALSDEMEEADAAMVLWPNASLIRALQAHGDVKLLADDSAAVAWWKNWLTRNKIPQDRISYFVINTDSIWIRDYGPWYILDGANSFGLVDTKYNRPRPNDDEVPSFISHELNIPLYQPGLVHTGGNYYPDEAGSAFSSTLVFTENPGLTVGDVLARVKDFLGIDHYVTSRLNPKITIEHMDTYGKLVAPDTWVFGEFPPGSVYKADSDRMAELLKTLKSPYGTPYKIYRMPMTLIDAGSGDFRAYINSFISNRALYFPTYGDSADDNARAIYQKALPGYEIIGVENQDTEWGDSVHCRTRNLLKRDTVFIFPRIEAGVVKAQVLPSPGARLTAAPTIHWKTSAGPSGTLAMAAVRGETNQYSAKIPAQGSGVTVSFWIEAQDSAGKRKTAPPTAPAMTIDYTN